MNSLGIHRTTFLFTWKSMHSINTYFPSPLVELIPKKASWLFWSTKRDSHFHIFLTTSRFIKASLVKLSVLLSTIALSFQSPSLFPYHCWCSWHVAGGNPYLFFLVHLFLLDWNEEQVWLLTLQFYALLSRWCNLCVPLNFGFTFLLCFGFVLLCFGQAKEMWFIFLFHYH